MDRRLITRFLELPQPSEDERPEHPFWGIIGSDEIRQALIFLTLTELRNKDVSDMSDKECRTILARCQSYVGLMDLEGSVKARLEEREKADEEDEMLDAIGG